MNTNSNTETETAFPSNSYSKLLSELRHGDVLREASEKLTKLVGETREHLRPGEITLKLKFQPASGGKLLTITDEIVVKWPKQEKEATLMFSTKDGALTMENPEQQKLDLREVPKDEKAPKSLTTEPTPLRQAAN